MYMYMHMHMHMHVYIYIYVYMYNSSLIYDFNWSMHCDTDLKTTWESMLQIHRESHTVGGNDLTGRPKAIGWWVVESSPNGRTIQVNYSILPKIQEVSRVSMYVSFFSSMFLLLYSSYSCCKCKEVLHALAWNNRNLHHKPHTILCISWYFYGINNRNSKLSHQKHHGSATHYIILCNLYIYIICPTHIYHRVSVRSWPSWRPTKRRARPMLRPRCPRPRRRRRALCDP